jgi:hypothetical protein
MCIGYRSEYPSISWQEFVERSITGGVGYAPALGSPLLTVPGNPEGSFPLAMPLTTADIGIQLLMDSTVNLQEIEARHTARVFAAVHHPERGPVVRAVLEQLLAVLDATRADGVI